MPVPRGEAFTTNQRQELLRAIADAERICGRPFSVYVGRSEGEPRQFAESLHAQLPNPAHSVLIHVDPTLRRLEIVTGEALRRTMTNRQVALAAIDMQAAFASGDLVRGLMSGIQQLAELGRSPELLHTDTP